MLSNEQLDSLKKTLLKEKEETEKELKNLGEGMDFGSDTDHLEEEADETEEFGNRLGVRQVLTKRLEKIDKALEKIKTGRYAKCERCGMDIEPKVLEADPESELCGHCKKSER